MNNTSLFQWNLNRNELRFFFFFRFSSSARHVYSFVRKKWEVKYFQYLMHSIQTLAFTILVKMLNDCETNAFPSGTRELKLRRHVKVVEC